MNVVLCANLSSDKHSYPNLSPGIAMASPESSRRKFALRFVHGLVASLLSAGAAAATIHVTKNDDRKLCGAFVNMVRAAGLETMSDDVLCDFRFASLPPDKRKGFTFPDWQRMDVQDPIAMYLRIKESNRYEITPPGQAQWNEQVAALSVAVAEGNVYFNHAQLSLKKGEKPLTFVEMDFKSCSKKTFKLNGVNSKQDGSDERYMDAIFPPNITSYKDGAMTKSLPITPSMGAEQLAVGPNGSLFDLIVPPIRIQSQRFGKPLVELDLASLRYFPESDVPYGHVKAKIMTIDTCVLEIY